MDRLMMMMFSIKLCTPKSFICMYVHLLYNQLAIIGLVRSHEVIFKGNC